MIEFILFVLVLTSAAFTFAVGVETENDLKFLREKHKLLTKKVFSMKEMIEEYKKERNLYQEILDGIKEIKEWQQGKKKLKTTCYDRKIQSPPVEGKLKSKVIKRIIKNLKN